MAASHQPGLKCKLSNFQQRTGTLKTMLGKTQKIKSRSIEGDTQIAYFLVEMRINFVNEIIKCTHRIFFLKTRIFNFTYKNIYCHQKD